MIFSSQYLASAYARRRGALGTCTRLRRSRRSRAHPRWAVCPPGAEELVEVEAFDRFSRLITIEAAVFNSELLCHRVGQFFHVIRHFSKSPDHRPKCPAALAVGVELRFKTIARVTSPCIQRFGPGVCLVFGERRRLSSLVPTAIVRV